MLVLTHDLCMIGSAVIILETCTVRREGYHKDQVYESLKLEKLQIRSQCTIFNCKGYELLEQTMTGNSGLLFARIRMLFRRSYDRQTQVDGCNFVAGTARSG